ncbi:MAG: hypothetical protein Q9178_004461 [Gyalolechia marmorata]
MGLSLLLLVASLAVRSVLSCADHSKRQSDLPSPGHLSRKRQAFSNNNPVYNSPDWDYSVPNDWGSIRPAYAVCQTGTQQSPIPLSLASGTSQFHQPNFQNYDRNVTGSWTNWGYGPAFNLEHPPGVYTSLPSMRWDNQTAYLEGWHIHAPAEHSVDGDKTKAEMHLVHVDAQGNEVAVLGIRLDPGTSSLPFFAQLPALVPFVTAGPGRNPNNNRPEVVPNVSMNMGLALDAVDRVSEFWTYKGSLTSPPCVEGLRWFVAREVALMSVNQMRTLLGASRYSARMEQEVWLHDVNGA